MNTTLQTFEAACGLTVGQSARLLGIPSPTYYQYRRTGKMPDSVRRSVEILSRLPDPILQEMISEYVFDGL